MKILRATHLGMCFGVRDAISLALAQSTPVTILGDLVHNDSVLEKLRAHQVAIEHSPDQIRTPVVMITAHGSSDRNRQQLRERGLRVVEATCPLVHVAHTAVKRLAQDGYHPVIVGQREHVEVRGLTGDLQQFDVILEDDDVERLAPRPRFGIAAQTTQPIDRVRRLVGRVEKRFPESEVRFADTVCQPTKQRQNAAIELARQVDVVLVIGGARSSNTRELVATCLQFCPRVHHLQSAADLRAVWFTTLDQAVGITAGTSTPDELVDGVERWLRDFVEFQHRLTGLSLPEATEGAGAAAKLAAECERPVSSAHSNAQ